MELVIRKGDRVTWTRVFGVEKKLKSSSCEFVRYVKGGLKVVVIQDDSFTPLNVPIGEVV